jgi:hypothetical protein
MLLRALSTFSESLSVHSLLKQHCILLQCKLFNLANYETSLKYGIEISYIKEWMNKTPKLLWELNTSNLSLTESLLDNLINIGRHSTQYVNLDIIQPALIPYIYTQVKKSQSNLIVKYLEINQY